MRDWLLANLPPGWGTPAYPKPAEPAEKIESRRGVAAEAHDGGWAGITWPREYGGRGATPVEQLIFNEEYTRAGAPDRINLAVGPALVGPTLIARGTEAQKRASCRASCAATTSGARASRSPTPARTSPR